MPSPLNRVATKSFGYRPWPLPDIDLFFGISNLIISSVGIVLNSFGIVCFLCNPPIGLSGLKDILTAITVVNLLVNISSMSTVARLIPLKGADVYVFIGPCAFLGPKSCNAMIAIQNHFYILQCSLLIFAFLNRYAVIRKCEVWNVCYRLTIFAVGYAPALTQMINFIYLYSSPILLQGIINVALPRYIISTYRIAGHANVFETRGIVHLALSHMYPLLAIFLSLLILAKIQQLSKKSTSNSRVFKRRLVKVISLQLFFPASMLLSSLLYFTGQFLNVHSILVEYTTVLLPSLAATISPIILFKYISTFRKFFRRLCQRFLGITSNKIASISQSRTSISAHESHNQSS